MVYADITYASGAAEMLRLATTRPDLASLSTAQALYGLPTAGTCRNADGSSSACQNYILEITNRSSLAHELDRPEIFISGALHGDERIGPSTALALSRWLIERYDTDPWMRRLVDQRIILVMPMTNAIGVEQRRRDELGIDPNRDFPYDQVPSACMQTVTARSINELYRARLLQLVVTFHGGMQAIAYNWGSFNYYQSKPHRSPDDVSQRQVAEQMSKFAGTGGSRTRNTKYLFKTMNDLVYPVHGGMEDWGYAASWDRAFVRTCEPRTYGGYEAARTTYSDAAVRAFTVLIETSDLKAPTADTYGAEAGVYNINSDADGHVPRNVRLSLAAIDLVRPHIAVWREGEATAAAAGSEVGAPVSAGGKEGYTADNHGHKTLAVQATSWLRGASIVVADASALANAAALVDEGAEPVSALALPLDSSDDPAEPALGLLTQLDDAWHGRAPTLLVMMLVGAAALVLLLCGLAGCLLRVRGGGGAVRPSEAEIARLRNKYECRVAQAEALSLLTDTQTDGETSTGSGSRP
eukprot:jgi/Chrpa1/7332/Chrysochromulina_OHIO_Genome00018148-RA